MFDNYKPELTGDVNEAASTPVESSTTKTEEVKAEAQTSADSKNTEEPEGKSVPYDRFKEVNQKYRDTEAKLKDYESKDSKYKTYAELDAAMIKDPVLNKEINKIIEKYNQGDLTKAEMKEEIAEAKAEAKSNPEIQQINQKFVKMNVQRYKDHFENVATKDYTDKDDLDLLEEYTSRFMLQKNPRAAEDFDKSLLEDCFKMAKDKLEGFSKRRMSGYVKEKTSDQPPVSKGGSSVSAEKEFKTRSEESAYFAAGLKAARQK